MLELLYTKRYNFAPFFLCGLDEWEISWPKIASQSGPGCSGIGLQRLVDIIDNVDNKKLSTNIFVVE